MSPSLPDVAHLPASEAVRLLAALADHDHGLPAAEQMRATEGRLRLAAREHPGPVPTGPISAGDLARAALAYLATTPERQAVIARVAAEPLDNSRFEAETLAVGALIAVALAKDLTLKEHAGRWTVRVSRGDAALDELLAKLMTYYRQ